MTMAGDNLPRRFVPAEPPPPAPVAAPATPGRVSFSATLKARILLNDEARKANPSANYLEEMTDRIIDDARGDARSAGPSRKLVISYIDGKPAQSVNHIFQNRQPVVDERKQKLFMSDPKLREMVILAEERAAELEELAARPDAEADAIIARIMEAEESEDREAVADDE